MEEVNLIKFTISKHEIINHFYKGKCEVSGFCFQSVFLTKNQELLIYLCNEIHDKLFCEFQIYLTENDKTEQKSFFKSLFRSKSKTMSSSFTFTKEKRLCRISGLTEDYNSEINLRIYFKIKSKAFKYQIGAPNKANIQHVILEHIHGDHIYEYNTIKEISGEDPPKSALYASFPYTNEIFGPIKNTDNLGIEGNTTLVFHIPINNHKNQRLVFFVEKEKQTKLFFGVYSTREFPKEFQRFYSNFTVHNIPYNQEKGYNNGEIVIGEI